MSSDGLKLFVTTWGHRRHAANPSWRHHRHVARIGQRGRSSETSGKSVTTREANLQVFSLKCTQSPFRHGAAKRKTSGGVTGSARLSNSCVTGWASRKYLTDVSFAVPPITPSAIAPLQVVWALEQRVSLTLATLWEEEAVDSVLTESG